MKLKSKMLLRTLAVAMMLLLALPFDALSQCNEKPTGNKKIAKEYMTFGQFTCALEEFLIMYKQKPEKPFLNRSIAECYAGIPGKEKNAVKYGEFLLQHNQYTAKDLWVLAYAYHKNYQFKKAIETCQKYILQFKPAEIELENVQRLIGNCENAQALMKFPLNIKFENLGERVNSKWDEFNPMSSADESLVIFTTTRSTVMGAYSSGNAFLSDLFVTKLKGKKYSNPRSLGSTFNGIDVDEYAGSSADNKYLFICTDGEGFQIFNLKYSHKGPRARSWPKPNSLTGINSKTSNEISATINNEGNLLIFSSDRPGGFGGYDLWLSRKLPDGNWGEPSNLGPQINTKFDEKFAQFNEDQDGILFASEGHINIGGFDVFKSSFWENVTKWSTAVNLGYPINTVHDDVNIQFFHNKRIAYKSDYREDSYGMSDLYRLVFSDSTPQLSVVKIMLKPTEEALVEIDSLKLIQDEQSQLIDSLKQVQNENGENLVTSATIDSLQRKIKLNKSFLDQTNASCIGEIIVSDSKTETEYGRYKSNKVSGEIMVILEPGSYELSVTAEGYHPLNKSLVIFDKNKFKPFINLSYTLRTKN